MSALMSVVPVLQAMAETARARGVAQVRGVAQAPELAFYRKYTEGMLRRYQRMSMEAGRVPSLLGQELFRSRVTSYRVRSFEDNVIFVLDIERCLGRLGELEQTLITRIAVQEYTQGETASMLRMSLRTVVRRYASAVDELTTQFLSAGLLEPLIACQGEEFC